MALPILLGGAVWGLLGDWHLLPLLFVCLSLCMCGKLSKRLGGSFLSLRKKYGKLGSLILLGSHLE